ncbi:MAG: hypothetical protein ACT4N8_05045 [Sphingosinicella sp.]|uniref:hypothetical protein n=1 Tax=Sphingosinicella sp. TaxID=1917971 RepID=UPI0040383C08
MGLRLAAFAAASLLAAAPAAAQNSAAPPPRSPPGTAAPPTTAPPPGTQPPPAITPPPVVVVPEPEPTANVVIVQPVQTVPDEPLTISPDAAYPNGFADPADPFGNDLSLARQEEAGFPWGLLGLLGLFGLIPLFRRGGRTTRTVYVDRDDPRRVIREERIED